MNPNFSPADSLLSAPSDSYPSLFDHDDAASPTATALTPQSIDDRDRSFSETPEASEAGDKKPVKKRKSWGQELPTPKTNLPPRKRAKTEDEKEQRRIERVLRNRAAAQSSRERKRKEVEGLEEEKRAIEQNASSMSSRLREMEMENHRLHQTIAKMAAEMTVFRKMVSGNLPSPDMDHASFAPTTTASLVQSSQTIPHLKFESDDLEYSLPPPQPTVDPRDAAFSSPSESPKMGPTAAVPNLTQHPAEVLCDLQCQLGATRLQWGSSPQTPTTEPRLASVILMTMSRLLLVSAASTAYSLILAPLAQIFSSLKTGSPLPDATLRTETLFPLIHWLISTATNPLSTSTFTGPTSSTRSTDHTLRSTFRIKLLRRLLACSPALARPLRDATGRALRLMSSGEMNRVSGSSSVGRDLVVAGRTESLMTTMWVLDSMERDTGGNHDKRKRHPTCSNTHRERDETMEEVFADTGH